MKKYKLLFGVCGIGRGHIYRQLPIISYFEKSCDIIIFAFGESHSFFKDLYLNHKNVKVLEVFVPWIHGGLSGIDYLRTANEPFNKKDMFISQNFVAMDAAFKWFGKPDLIISDYEPISAQYSYTLDAPLVTIDQQSKYFYGGYPSKLDNLGVQEERARLNLFFPKADARIACSFFQSPSDKSANKNLKVMIVPPVIRDEIVELKIMEHGVPEHVLVYLSPYSSFVQSAEEVLGLLAKFSKYSFHLFVSKKADFLKVKHQLPNNITINFHGDKEFLHLLQLSGSAICTAGHMFISEMMFLNKPVYAIPLQTYEQKYNAKIIGDNKFGITHSQIEVHSLHDFLANITKFKHNIVFNNKVLLNEEPGQIQIVNFIEKMLKSSYED